MKRLCHRKLCDPALEAVRGDGGAGGEFVPGEVSVEEAVMSDAELFEWYGSLRHSDGSLSYTDVSLWPSYGSL